MRYDLTGDPFRAWRKNRQVTSAGVPIYTDLNRNYSYRFACCGGSSNVRSATTYRGPAAFSAPETRALRNFVESRVIGGIQQIRTHITLHTNGELILWPYGYTKTDLPPDMTAADRSAFVGLGRAMAARNGYKAEQSSDLYITDGDQIDWLYYRHRIFSFTFELYPTETPTVWGDHYPPDERIAAQTARNRSAILYLIDQAACPYAASTQAAAAINDCGPLYDDFEIDRAPGSATRAATTPRRPGSGSGRCPQATTALGPQAAGHGRVRAARAASPAPPRGRRPTPTTSTAGRRSAAARSRSTPTRPTSARSRSATCSPTPRGRPPTTTCASGSRPRTGP